MQYGPQLRIAEEIHRQKYRLTGESFRESVSRVAAVLGETPEHFHDFRQLLLEQYFLPAGRVQSAVGSPQKITAFNCFVSGTIPDSMDGIMDRAKEAAQTMRLGGGIGYDFSTIRPREALITTLSSKASGAVSFMEIYNAICATVSSAGERRGAQMGVLRVDHPDIEEFIEAKTNDTRLLQFNISIGITDEFMNAVLSDSAFNLKFNGIVYKTVSAKALFDRIMRAAWDWAEPGVLFIDRINAMNNLYYCETITATNPCGEQPLPPYGACLLGSFNLPKVTAGDSMFEFAKAIPMVVRAMDNVIDNTVYPLPQHEVEAKSKRRIGLGITGLANALERYAGSYGSESFLKAADSVFKTLTETAYKASIDLAKEKGAFPLFDRDKYLGSRFIQGLSDEIQQGIYDHGIRNSHLISYAPAGTISITADNVSSGIEPVFSYQYDRTMLTPDGTVTETIQDYSYRMFGTKGKIANECSIDNHLNVLALASHYSDSAVSKTINVGDQVTWNEFKSIYIRAWEMGCKGCTTFCAAGKRYGVLNEGAACYIDKDTGAKTCG